MGLGEAGSGRTKGAFDRPWGRGRPSARMGCRRSGGPPPTTTTARAPQRLPCAHPAFWTRPQVQDLGGWLSPRSWARRLFVPGYAASAGTEALVERMLMSVMLVGLGGGVGRVSVRNSTGSQHNPGVRLLTCLHPVRTEAASASPLPLRPTHPSPAAGPRHRGAGPLRHPPRPHARAPGQAGGARPVSSVHAALWVGWDSLASQRAVANRRRCREWSSLRPAPSFHLPLPTPTQPTAEEADYKRSTTLLVRSHLQPGGPPRISRLASTRVPSMGVSGRRQRLGGRRPATSAGAPLATPLPAG
jgi:hypothetical protein